MENQACGFHFSVFAHFRLLTRCFCRGREIKCKHLVATALCAVLWKNHRNERPSWAAIRARVILTQEDRVKLDRNFSWAQLLQFTLNPYPTGHGYWKAELEIEDAAPAPTREQKKGKPKTASGAKQRKRRQQSSEES